MSEPAGSERPLVVGELRGYRQFQLAGDGLRPLVHTTSGPWDAQLERAQCALGGAHAAPAVGCTCGLYAMYRPGSATVSLGGINAVVAARGRCVLGDRGFRAAAARVEAVAVPPSLRVRPWAAARARAALAAQYPATRVYGSTRQMLRHHPPQDVRELGICPPPDRSRGYRSIAVLLWATFVLAGYSVVLLPKESVSDLAAQWWPVLVLLLLAWQAALVWLLTRLMALQMPEDPGAAPPAR